MRVEEFPIYGLYLFHPDVYNDSRGYFQETYNEGMYEKIGITNRFVQDNQALSIQPGVLRGLHFQLPPYTQAKLVRVITGSILDVAVDLRRDSPTYCKWQSVELSGENKAIFFVPRGFAHAYITLCESTIVHYKVDDYYSPDHESGIIWNDSDLGIDWPLKNPILSQKDRALQSFADFDSSFYLNNQAKTS